MKVLRIYAIPKVIPLKSSSILSTIQRYLPTQQTNDTDKKSMDHYRASKAMKDTNIPKKNIYKKDKIYNKDIDVQYKNEYIYIAIPFPPLSKNPADHIPENPVEKLLEAIDPKTTTNTTVTTNIYTPIKEKIVTYLKKESTKEKINGNVSSLKKNIGPLMEKISQNATMKNIVEKLMSTINSKEDFTLNMNAFFLAANEKNKRNIKEISGKETTFNHLNNNNTIFAAPCIYV